MVYQLNLTCVVCSSDNRLYSSLSNENYIIPDYLKYLSDNGFYYLWTVRASDSGGFDYGNWTVQRKINISSFISIVLLNNSVNFGAILPGASEDTSDDNPKPFVLENDGNSFVNVSINATDLWKIIQNPSQYFKYKIDNRSNGVSPVEPGSFDSLLSKISWANVPNNLISDMSIALFNWSDATDSCEIDLNITVPPNEEAGDKLSRVQFTAGLAE